jgi:hypothetical protein
MIAVRRGHIAQDFGNGADAMQVLGPRRVDRGILLQNHADRLVGARGGLGSGDGSRAAKAERRHHAGKENGVARRQDDQGAIGQFELGG